jgi:FlaA1/EpsC-like NDP-sugar epimerase
LRYLSIDKLLNIDATGAASSFVSLGLLLPQIQHLIGIPKTTLYFLAFFPACFLLFNALSRATHLLPNQHILRILVLLNVSYCVLSVSFCLYHYEVMERIGWVYFVLEVLVVLVLSRYEWKAVEAVNMS